MERCGDGNLTSAKSAFIESLNRFGDGVLFSGDDGLVGCIQIGEPDGEACLVDHRGRFVGADLYRCHGPRVILAALVNNLASDGGKPKQVVSGNGSGGRERNVLAVAMSGNKLRLQAKTCENVERDQIH